MKHDGYASSATPPKSLLKVDGGPAPGARLDWTHREWADLRARMIVVDGVSYSVPAIRQIILERHQLAEKNRRLSDQLRRNDIHLRRRTAALVRLIARSSTMTTCSCPTSPGSAASRCSTGCCAGRAGLEIWRL